MARRIANRHYWTGDSTEMALDLESEGMLGYLTSKRTDEWIINRDIRRAMIDYLLRWSYGVVHRQSMSLKVFTAQIADDYDVPDETPSADDKIYIEQIMRQASERLKPRCRIVKHSSYEAVIKAMIEQGDPYLEGDSSKNLRDIGIPKSTVCFMKKAIQHAFREALGKAA